MKILIVAHFSDGANEHSNNRFNYLYNLLKKTSYNVMLITSDFSHREKIYRNNYNKDESIIYIHEPQYQRNISLKRFYSHLVFAKNLKRYLKDVVKPDIVYCAVPSLNVGYVMSKYCKKNNIKFIIDIQDLWPEAFKMAFNIPILSNMIFYPMKKEADIIYASADKIIAVSDTYRDRGLKVNKKDKQGLTVFLGTDLKDLDKKMEYQDITYKKNKNEFWIGYIGTIGSSYDIETSLKAVLQVQKEISNVKYILLGDGPLLEKFKKMAKELQVNAVFLGRKDYIEAMKILSQCDIALNPLVKEASQSIINKVGDYAALGLPVVNSLQNEEYILLLDRFEAGITVECENVIMMSKEIKKLINNPDLCQSMGRCNRRLAEEKFDRKKTYSSIVDCVINIGEK